MKTKVKNQKDKKKRGPSRFAKIIAKLAMIAVGIVFIVYPGTALTIVVRILGAVLMLIGFIGVISFVSSPYKGVLATFLFVLSCLAILLAFIPLLNPPFIIAFFPFVIGLALAIKGIADIVESITLRKVLGIWFVPLSLSILTVVAGCVIAFYPFHTMDLLVRIVGVICVYNALVGLFMVLSYRPKVGANGVVDITDSN